MRACDEGAVRTCDECAGFRGVAFRAVAFRGVAFRATCAGLPGAFRAICAGLRAADLGVPADASFAPTVLPAAAIATHSAAMSPKLLIHLPCRSEILVRQIFFLYGNVVAAKVPYPFRVASSLPPTNWGSRRGRRPHRETCDKVLHQRRSRGPSGRSGDHVVHPVRRALIMCWRPAKR